MSQSRISDSQYERELRTLETQLQRRIAEWENALEAWKSEIGKSRRAHNDSGVAAERHEWLLQLIEITGEFWYAREKAYFRCCERNRRLLSRKGRPPKHFRWFRTVPTSRKVGPGRRPLDAGDAVIVARAVALVRAGSGLRGQQRAAVADALSGAGGAILRHHRDGTASERINAIRSLDIARFDRISRAVSRALKEPSK